MSRVIVDEVFHYKFNCKFNVIKFECRDAIHRDYV